MNKRETLNAIEDAREAHIEQLEKVKLLIQGMHVKNLTPISKMKCQFGHWLYGDAQKMKDILGVQFYEDLDIIHEAWHLVYAKIYAIYIGEEKEGVFSRLFRKHKVVSAIEREKANLHFKDLEHATKDLLRVLDASQRRVQALNESKFH